jgi:hypothetical protein
MTRQEIIDLIHNEYDPAPSYYTRTDNWDDGSGRIADAVMHRIEQLEAALREIANDPDYGGHRAQVYRLITQHVLSQKAST